VLAPIRVDPDRGDVAFADNGALLRLGRRCTDAERKDNCRDTRAGCRSHQSEHRSGSFPPLTVIVTLRLCAVSASNGCVSAYFGDCSKSYDVVKLLLPYLVAIFEAVLHR
jgi:hypothetical protein